MNDFVNEMTNAGLIKPIESPVEGVQAFAMQAPEPELTTAELKDKIRQLDRLITDQNNTIIKLSKYKESITRVIDDVLYSDTFKSIIKDVIEDIQQDIDYSELASNIDYSDLAYELHYDNLAEHVDIGEIGDYIELDYDMLAQSVDTAEIAEHFSIDVRVNR